MQFSWFLFSLGAPLMWGLTNIFDQMLQRNYAKDEVNLTLATAVLRLPVGLLLFLIFGFFLPSIPIILLSFLHGFLTVFPLFFYLRSLQMEEATRVIIFYQITPVFVLLFSYFLLGEILSLQQIGAFFVLLFAGFLSVFRSDVRYRFLSPAALWGLLTVIFWAFADVLVKYLLQFFPSPSLLLPWSYVGSFLMLIPLSFFPFFQKRFHWSSFAWLPRAFPLLFISLITAVVGFYFFFHALDIGFVSLTSVFLGIQPLFVFLFLLILGSFFRSVPREDFRRRALVFKLLAFAISILGLAMIY